MRQSLGGVFTQASVSPSGTFQRFLGSVCELWHTCDHHGDSCMWRSEAETVMEMGHVEPAAMLDWHKGCWQSPGSL